MADVGLRDRRWLGREAYDAYCKALSAEGQTWPQQRDRLPIVPAWDFLLDIERKAWHAAAEAIANREES